MDLRGTAQTGLLTAGILIGVVVPYGGQDSVVEWTRDDGMTAADKAAIVSLAKRRGDHFYRWMSLTNVTFGPSRFRLRCFAWDLSRRSSIGGEKSSLDDSARIPRKTAKLNWRAVWDDFRNWLIRSA